MRQTFLWLMALVSLVAGAQSHHLTASQAMQRIGMASSSVRTMRKAPAVSNERYYVFNREEGGFVIASADDRARAILGYCDEGQWDPNNIPPAMQGWLQSMSDALRILAADPNGEAIDDAAAAKASPRRRAATTRVEPLLGGIKWGQNTPYNNLCPASGQTHSATGCAATAMAQIMRYHKWPLEGRGSNTYSTSTIGGTISETFTGTHYDWANMLEQYFLTVDGRPNNYNDTQATAVATLMYHLGVASSMDYNTGASGTTEGPMLQAMVENFDYDRSLQIYYRENFTSQEWYTLLQDEIDNERPVLMNGYSISGGHAFVIDGYDTTMGAGYFHFNWGWNGMSDGYYSVDITDPGQQGTGGSLGGYSYNQNIFTHITKQAGGSAEPNLCVSAALRYEYGQLHFQALNRGCGAFTGEIGYVVEDNGARGFHSVQAYSGMGFREGTGSMHISISAPTKAGLRYYLASKVGSTITELRPIVGAPQALVSVSDGKGGYTLIPEASDLAQLQVTNIELEGHAYAGATTNFRITVRNVGQTEYNAALYMCVTETNEEGQLGYSELATTNPLGVYLRPGEENTYSFPFYSTLAVGKYLAEVFYNPRNGSGVQLVNGESLTFDVVPFGSLDEEKNPPVLEIYEQSLTPAKIYADSELSFSVTVDNAGGTDETTVGGIIFKKNGNNWQQIGILDEKTISIAEGESTLTFTGTPELEVGRYRISLGYNDGMWWQFSQGKYTTFTVEEEPEEPVDPEPGPGPNPGEPVAGEASVTALSLANGTTAPANATFQVNFTVSNDSNNEDFEFHAGIMPLDADGNPDGEYAINDGDYDWPMSGVAKGESHSGTLNIPAQTPGKYRLAIFNFDFNTFGYVQLPGQTLDIEVGEGGEEPAGPTYDYLVRFTGDVPNDPSVVIKGQTYTSRFGGSIWLESEELTEDDIIADMDGYNVIVSISGNAEDGFTITVDYQHEWVLRLINAPADATVNVDGTERTTGVFSAAFVTIVAAEYDNYDVDVQVDRTKHTITATYTPWPTWTVEVIGADEETTVRINDIDYKNGDRFHAKNVNLDDIEPSDVSGRVASVARVGYTIKVTYVREDDLSGNYKFKFTNGRYISFANGSAAAVEDASQATVFTVTLDEDADLYSIYVNENISGTGYLGSQGNALSADAPEDETIRWAISVFTDGLDNEGYSFEDTQNTSSTTFLGFNSSVANKAPYMSGGASVIAFVPVTYPLGVFTMSAEEDKCVKAAPSCQKDDRANISDGGAFTSVVASSTDYSILWEAEPTGENTCRIKHVNSGYYLANNAGAITLAANAGDASDCEYAKEGNNIYLKTGGKYVTFDSGLQASAEATTPWKCTPITAVEYKIGSTGYGTLCLPFDFELPEGLTANIITGVNSATSLRVEAIDDNGKAGEGYIMQGEPGTYTLVLTEDADAHVYNLLYGTTCRQTGFTAGSFYGLKAVDDKAVMAVSSTTAVPANKAVYIPASTNPVSTFVLDFSEGVVTEIADALMQDTSSCLTYDLQGRAVNQQKLRGIFLHNGRKIIK